MTTQPSHPEAVLRFGVFELDRKAGELRRNGSRLRIQEQPFQLLAILLERPGEVFDKEDLQGRLWPDVSVDADAGLGEAVYRLRQKLGDSAHTPRYIETIPRKGYRFVAAVESAPSTFDGESDRLLSKRAIRFALYAVVGILGAGGALLWSSFKGVGPDPTDIAGSVVKFSIRPSPPPNSELSRTVVSPDGRRIAYTNEEGLWVHDLTQDTSRLLVSEGRIIHPFWSPDSASIAFVATDPDELRKVPWQGGETILICKISRGVFQGGAWSPDGSSIVFSETNNRVLYQTPAGGGEPTPVFSDAELEGIAKQVAAALGLPGLPPPLVASPQFLPAEEGRRLLLLDFGRGSRQSLVAVDLDTREVRVLTPGGYPVYAPSGYIIFVADEDLWAVGFDLRELRLTADPFRIAQDAASPSVADDGTLFYLDRPQGSGQLIWVDRKGRQLGPAVSEPHEFLVFRPQISPSGRYALFAAKGPRSRELRVLPNLDLWVYDLSRPLGKLLLTQTPDAEAFPTWARGDHGEPAQEHVAFSWTKRGESDIYIKPLDPDVEPTALIEARGRQMINDWSDDGRYILYRSNHPKTAFDLWYAERAEDGKTWKTHPFAATEFTETLGSFSPDGRYVVYQSDSSGSLEIHVRSFPDGSVDRQVSTNSGGRPLWSPDGDELFYVEGSEARGFYSVPVSTEPVLSVGKPQLLFERPELLWCDAAQDAQRFLCTKFTESTSEPEIRVVQNWVSEFR